MRNIRSLILAIVLGVVFFSSTVVAHAVNVIPIPQYVELTDKLFNKDYLDNILYKKDFDLPSEAYEIHIDDFFIIIRYSDESGRFYAHQTLNQLAEDDFIYCGLIKDAPRYKWRGLLLDEARHFFGKEKVKELLDLMARYKLNRFHWHLSDNQGWRVEIKAYPELCTVGGIGCHSNRTAPAKYYTQEEIKDIVKYAADRHIEVIPEIDMPGHARAFGKVFPHLYAGHSTVNPVKEELYVVLETVINELAELFPGRYIHIGGDEVSTEGWQESSEINTFMRRENIRSYNDIQKYFEKRYTDIVRKAGKISIAWDEVISGNLDIENTVIQWWRGERPEDLRKCLDMGYKAVICPWNAFYLDYAQDKRCTSGHLISYKLYNTLQKLYEYKFPEHPGVLGIQANLWTEYISSDNRFDYTMFPRAIATAEKAWSSSENIDYYDFLRRLDKEYIYLDSLGIYYYDIRQHDAHIEPYR